MDRTTIEEIFNDFDVAITKKLQWANSHLKGNYVLEKSRKLRPSRCRNQNSETYVC